jgi:predicted nucleotidyltransferase
VNRLEAALHAIGTELNQRGMSWALVGGLAVSARAEPRFTRDIDLALAVADDADADALVHALVARGYRVMASLEQESVGRLATVRLEAPGEGPEGVVVDLLLASSGIEPELVQAADVLEVFPGLSIRVARGGHLLALKVLSKSPRRPQDAVDIAALLRRADAADIDEARAMCALVVRRGYGRGRDLPRLLEEELRASGRAS